MSNNDSIEQFLIKSEKRAFLMARIATRDEDVALDIVQDAMLKLVTKYGKKSSQDWPPLFYRILQSRINDWHRRQNVRNKWRSWFSNEKDNIEDEPRESSLENHSNEADIQPDGGLQSFEFGETLEKAIGELPLRQQQAFMLRAWEQYSTAETSKIMQCSEGSVKTHYSRALNALKQQLTDFKLNH